MGASARFGRACEAVTYARFGREKTRMCGVVLNLSPQLADENAQILAVVFVRRTPNGF
jgi:hypothetical protein